MHVHRAFCLFSLSSRLRHPSVILPLSSLLTDPSIIPPLISIPSLISSIPCHPSWLIPSPHSCLFVLFLILTRTNHEHLPMADSWAPQGVRGLQYCHMEMVHFFPALLCGESRAKVTLFTADTRCLVRCSL